MLAGTTDDATGLILHAVRERVGSSVPIVGSIDLHANLPPLIVKTANALVAYRAFPHTDFREVGALFKDVITIDSAVEPLRLIAEKECREWNDGRSLSSV